MGFLFVVVAFVALLAGFLGARIAAAPAGSRRLRVALGFEPDAWAGTSFGRRAGFALAGLAGFYLVTALILAVGDLAAGNTVQDETSMRVTVGRGGPADLAGIRDGDRVVSVNGAAPKDWDDLRKLVGARKNEALAIDIDRQGEPLTVSATPGNDGKLRIGPFTEQHAVGVGEAFAFGVSEPPKVWLTTLKSLGRIFAGREKSEVTGPVGVVRETGRAASTGLGNAMKLVGLIAAYLFWAPTLVTLVAFPRGRRRVV